MVIVNADDGAGEGEDLAEGGEDSGVDDTCRWDNEGGNEEDDAENNEEDGNTELGFHIAIKELKALCAIKELKD